MRHGPVSAPHALPMQEPGREGLGRADPRRPRRSSRQCSTSARCLTNAGVSWPRPGVRCRVRRGTRPREFAAASGEEHIRCESRSGASEPRPRQRPLHAAVDLRAVHHRSNRARELANFDDVASRNPRGFMTRCRAGGAGRSTRGDAVPAAAEDQHSRHRARLAGGGATVLFETSGQPELAMGRRTSRGTPCRGRAELARRSAATPRRWYVRAG
jgi:hypothetical protein